MNRITRAVRREAAAKQYKKQVREHKLRWLEIEITRRCPLACLHCGSSCSDDPYYKEELSGKELLDFFNRIDNAYGAQNVMLCFTGGEPLMRPDLFTIMAHATEMGYRTTMVTNGLLINERTVDLLAAAGLSTITVSLDGMEESHNWARGNPESFAGAVNALGLLKSSGHFHVVEAFTCVSKKSLEELEQMRELLRVLQTDHWRLTRVFPIGRAIDYPELILNGSELHQLLAYLKKQRAIEPDFLSYAEEGCLGREYDHLARDCAQHCDAGVHILTLLADGSVTGCAAVDHAFIQGNIRTGDPVELWENAFQPFRERSWMQTGICGSCEDWRYCHGDGMHLWHPDKKNPANCVQHMLQ